MSPPVFSWSGQAILVQYVREDRSGMHVRPGPVSREGKQEISGEYNDVLEVVVSARRGHPAAGGSGVWRPDPAGGGAGPPKQDPCRPVPVGEGLSDAPGLSAELGP